MKRSQSFYVKFVGQTFGENVVKDIYKVFDPSTESNVEVFSVETVDGEIYEIACSVFVWHLNQAA
ncbi:hypothetical protein ACA29_03095 [Lederbergia galactosidilytica]|uniref:Uncharacterized protein n=1 Tax=Lederbergia galactosidilytica TaxID=217031 RepID=A0A0Q9Y7T5_9BACI|nr:hypothetical protein ACA29_03095 [Lederbergia galactosidilytica]